MTSTLPAVPAAQPSVRSDVEVARHAAEAAGAALLGLRTTRVADPAAPDAAPLTGSALRAAGDALAQRTIMEVLTRLRPADAVLSEEAADNPVRLSAERVWIIDPLDGTREYGDDGRVDWAVHVALWEGGELTTAAVGLPALGAVLVTHPAPPPPAATGPGAAPRMAVSRSRATPLVMGVAEDIGADLIPLGSAGYKVCAVVRGEVDAYVHSGGQYEWDSAAPVAIARAAGLHTSRLDGSPLRYNQPDPYLPDLIVCRPELAPAILASVTGRSAP